MKLYVLVGICGICLGLFLIHLWIGPTPTAAQATSKTQCHAASALQTMRLYANGNTNRIDAIVQAAETGHPVLPTTCK